MKIVITLLCLAVCSNIECYESEESTEVFVDAEDCCDSEEYYDDDTDNCCRNEEYDDDEFEDAYDNDIFFNKLEEDQSLPMNKTKVSLNCFGLGGKFSRLMESFLKNDANGTKALKVVFYSSSRDQSERIPIRCGDYFSLDEIDFDITKRTVFIVHGFFSSGDEQWIEDMEKALLLWDDLNIFVVDWSDGANTWNYFKAAFNTKTVGDQIATFINQIINEVTEYDGPDPSKWGPLHLIGHSLGAHICGYAAHELKLRGAQWTVHRITGLDPAQPCFRKSDLSLRLDRSDAHFVDVIHTNGRILRKLGLGLPYPLGHVDFYPNGGSIQPGCFLTKSSFWNYLPLPIEKIKRTICSHGRSQLYLTESIITAVERNCTFWAHEWDMSYNGLEKILSNQCDVRDKYHKCIEMGINAEKYDYNGTFFAVTGSSSPYCSVDKQSIDDIMHYIEEKKMVVLEEN